MPRKVNYGVDCDQEDYGVYEDYDDDFYDDYDQDSEVEGYEETSKVAEAYKIDQATTKPGLWRCPMCTFDNAESLSACDICGVFRVPLFNNNGNKETVSDVSKGSGASILAKSLFAPVPRRTLKKAVLFQQKNDDLASKERD